jgi:NAD(P)-dependent dehydrogenase (short-subunit alcohol dehydrogenase family)
MNFSGKLAFITGGARRLGREVALHLRRNGCEVVVHYNRSHAEAEQLRNEAGCRLFHADFSTAKVQELLQRLEAEIGSVDFLISNASSFRRSHWTEITEQLWDDEMSVVLKIPFFLIQHFGIRMKKRGAGKIIQMADVAAQHPYLQYLPYSIAKAGAVALTRAFARALAPEVQVNAIAPGVIFFPEDFPETEKKKIVERIPARRTGTVDELLQAVDFLLRDAHYITGQTIVLDGGRSLSW